MSVLPIEPLPAAPAASAEKVARIGVVLDGSNPKSAVAILAAITSSAGELPVNANTTADTPPQLSLRIVSDAAPANAHAQARAVDSLVYDRVSGILLDPIDRQVLAPALARARDAGIPVVILNSRVGPGLAAQAVSSDNRETGRAAARQLAALLDGKGDVMLMRRKIFSTKYEEREEGFIEAVVKEFPGLRLVASDYHSGMTVRAATGVAGALLKRYPAIQGVFVSSEAGTLGMLQALRAANLAGGRIKLIGVSEGNAMLHDAMLAGDVQGFLTENHGEIGRVALRTLAQILAGLRKPPSPSLVEAAWVSADGRFPIKPVTDCGQARKTGAQSACAAHEKTPDIRAGKNADAEANANTLTAIRAGKNYTVPDLGLRMLAVSPGTFERKARDDTSAQKVILTKAYWLGACEITQAQWSAIMGENPSEFVSPRRPVDTIDWNMAVEFCRRLTSRERDAGRLPDGFVYALPTEAEWEYAARAGSEPPGAAELADCAWTVLTSGACDPDAGFWRLGTHSVARKRPNAWGFYDMVGNVAELCADWFADYAGAEAVDPRGPANGAYKVLRGGCWWADAQNCLASSRHKAPPTRRHGATGMRVALTRGE